MYTNLVILIRQLEGTPVLAQHWKRSFSNLRAQSGNRSRPPPKEENF